jgi:hypothetical protein
MGHAQYHVTFSPPHGANNEWLGENPPMPSVTASMVADLFERSEETVTADLRKALTSYVAEQQELERQLRWEQDEFVKGSK